jgi:hypothetical protein
MMVRTRIPAALVGVTLSAGLLSGCGSSTKVSDAGFIPACVKKFGVPTSQCRCLQQKLVAAGQGGFDYTANTAPPKVAVALHAAGQACGFSAPPTSTGTGTGTST